MDMCLTSRTVTWCWAPPVSSDWISCCHGFYASYKLLYKPMANVMGKGDFRPLKPQNHWTDFNKTWFIELHTGGHSACKLWLRYSDVGGLGEWPVCHTVFFSVFVFFVKPTDHTMRQIWTSEGSKTCRSAQGSAFWWYERCAPKF